MREPFHKARVYITTLLVVEICLGCSIVLMTAIYHHILGSYLPDIERKMLRGQFFNTYLLGCQLIVTYVCSMAMWRRVWARRCTPNIQLMLTVWMFFCFLIVICGFGTVWSLFTCAGAMENTAEMSLTKGIDLYYTCPEWKLLWDGLQFHKECCGVHGYKDWMKASWMPPDVLQSPAPEDERCPQMEQRKTTLAPYACCKHACNACFENYIPRSGNSGIPYLNLTQINTEGCLHLFSDSMWNILYILLALVIIAFKIDIIICCLARYILRRQECEDYSRNNSGLMDDEGRPMVVVKCPPNVRCVSIEEEEDGSMMQLGGRSSPDRGRQKEKPPCNCFGGLKRHYTIKQEEVSPSASHQRQSQTCECCPTRNESRFLH